MHLINYIGGETTAIDKTEINFNQLSFTLFLCTTFAKGVTTEGEPNHTVSEIFLKLKQISSVLHFLNLI